MLKYLRNVGLLLYCDKCPWLDNPEAFAVWLVEMHVLVLYFATVCNTNPLLWHLKIEMKPMQKVSENCQR